jgi:RNA polymerase sigma factor (sigma-70 family)
VTGRARAAPTESSRRYSLPPKLERELVAAAGAGDAPACRQLVDAFQPAIASVARMYRSTPGVDRAELMQEGVVGLLRAVRRFDADVGVPFWAYASWWVRQAMQQLVAEVSRPIVLSDRALRELATVKRAGSEYSQSHGRDASIRELSLETGICRRHIESLLAIDRPARGLEQPLRGEDGATGTLLELIEDPSAEDEFDRVVERFETRLLADLSDRLGKREREIVSEHYGLGRPAQTLREIGGRLDLSAERVRQIEEGAFEKLRAAAA